jgi:hypothetical protein
MTQLKPIQIEPTQDVPYGSDSPIIPCDMCGTQKPRHLMFDFVANVLCPGHPALTGIGCPVQHWACSMECWVQVAHACIDEHVLMILKYNHDVVLPQVKEKYPHVG